MTHSASPARAGPDTERDALSEPGRGAGPRPVSRIILQIHGLNQILQMQEINPERLRSEAGTNEGTIPRVPETGGG